MTERELSDVLFWAYNSVWLALVLLMGACEPEPCHVSQIVAKALHVYCNADMCISPGAHTEHFTIAGSQVFDSRGDEVGYVDLVSCEFVQ